MRQVAERSEKELNDVIIIYQKCFKCFLILCVHACYFFNMFVCTPEEVMWSHELQLERVVICHVAAGEWTQDLW